jgi:hypothetical protein
MRNLVQLEGRRSLGLNLPSVLVSQLVGVRLDAKAQRAFEARQGRVDAQLWANFKISSFSPCSAESINGVGSECSRLDPRVAD